MDIFFVAKLIGAVSAVAGAGSVMWLKAIRPAFIFVSSIYSQWNKIVNELTPNGGSSIKDAIGRIETRQMIEVQVRKALSNDSISGVWEASADGQLTYANRTFQRIVGRSLGDLEGWGWVNSIHPEDREKVLKEWKLALEQEREARLNFRVLNEEPVSVVSVSHPLRDRAGNLKGYIGQLVTCAQSDDVFFSKGD